MEQKRVKEENRVERGEERREEKRRGEERGGEGREAAISPISRSGQVNAIVIVVVNVLKLGQEASNGRKEEGRERGREGEKGGKEGGKGGKGGKEKLQDFERD